MMKSAMAALATLGVACGLLACVAAEPVIVMPEVSATARASNSLCALEAPQVKIISNAEGWQQWVAAHPLDWPVPPDWSTQARVIIALGNKPTAGYGLSFSGFSQENALLKLAVQQHKPPADAMVAQMITSPCLVVDVSQQGWQFLQVTGTPPFPITLDRLE